MFKGDMDKWKRFANTLKLRLLIKMAGVTSLKASFVDAQFAAMATSTVGFLQDDALNNPGYFKEAGRQNPNYNYHAYSATEVRSQGQATATKWILTFYNGNKILDNARGTTIFRGFPATNANRLGDESSATVVAPT